MGDYFYAYKSSLIEYRICVHLHIIQISKKICFVEPQNYSVYLIGRIKTKHFSAAESGSSFSTLFLSCKVLAVNPNAGQEVPEAEG